MSVSSGGSGFAEALLLPPLLLSKFGKALPDLLEAESSSRGFFELCRAGGKSDAHDEQASRFGPPEP